MLPKFMTNSYFVSLKVIILHFVTTFCQDYDILADYSKDFHSYYYHKFYINCILRVLP